METNKSKRRGKREGAGRKATVVKFYTIGAPQDVVDIIESVEGNKSQFIFRAIRFAAEKGMK